LSIVLSIVSILSKEIVVFSVIIVPSGSIVLVMLIIPHAPTVGLTQASLKTTPMAATNQEPQNFSND
jgi:hypothetical protein